MYISFNWLKEYLSLPAKIGAKEVAEALTAHTVEVESVNYEADKFINVVVGKVISTDKHPNADKLKTTVIDVKDNKLNIVCGAPNIEAGQLVPVALVGAILPNGLEIKASKIRGEVSEGMVCAPDELGLGSDHEGIMVLDKKAKIGQPFAKYLGLDDIVFEVDNKSLSNRPDLLNHYGLARELSAIFKVNLSDYEKNINKFKLDDTKKENFKVELMAKDACSRYMAVKIDNIKVEESPAWLKKKLVAINQKPINNIVDLANFVMFDCGQPLHTFDANKVDKIKIRRAKDHENIETLDGKVRDLNEKDLVIASSNEPIALAGIMGGKNSEININSTALLLESANFSAADIRNSSQKHNLRTEASLRYEKSLDPQLCEQALNKYISLLLEICPDAKIVSQIEDVYQNQVKDVSISLKYQWLIKKIGQEIKKEDAVKSLELLGFEVSQDEDDVINLKVPSWRATKDIAIKEDIVEEVLRLHGYENIDSSLPQVELSYPQENKEKALEREVKDILSLRFVLTEVQNYSFIGEEQLEKINVDFLRHLKIINPISGLNNILRQSLIPALIYNIKDNQAKKENIELFEIGNVFMDAPSDYDRDEKSQEKLPYQEKRLALAISDRFASTFSRSKDYIYNFLTQIMGSDSELVFSKIENIPGWAENGLIAKVSLNGHDLGLIGELGDKIKKNVGLKTHLSVLEINFNKLHDLYENKKPFRLQEAAKYPVVIRDVCFVISDKIMYNDIKVAINSFNPLIKNVELFDVYAGDKLETKERSLAFHITYQSDEKTLTSSEVENIQSGLIKEVSDKFNAKIRNF